MHRVKSKQLSHVECEHARENVILSQLFMVTKCLEGHDKGKMHDVFLSKTQILVLPAVLEEFTFGANLCFSSSL